ncbi:MAG: FecCD family ABC transporter permease [Flavobacteriaceae bacterium]
MPPKKISPWRFVLLAMVLAGAFILNISLGSVHIPFADTLGMLFGGEASNESWRYILFEYRLPKGVTAMLTGSGLALSGLLMQTLFRNPLAGPFVLGISSGASLGVALLIMGASFFMGFESVQWINSLSLVLAAGTGSFMVLFLVMIMASKVRDTMALLIIGLMLGSITSAVVAVLAHFSQAESLQQYIFWSFGSLGDLRWGQVGFLSLLVLLGLGLSIVCIKPLNALLLGERYAQSLGVSLKQSRFIIILATGLLAGGITAFAGPIAFIGLAVPHLTRQLIPSSNHQIMVPTVMGYGAILLLLCDTVAQWPGHEQVLPLNAVTSMVGAPVVIWLLVRKRKAVF